MSDAMTNPYKNTLGTPQMRPSVAAFVDILGYSDYIDRVFNDKEEGKSEKELNRLINALNEAQKYIKNKSGDSASQYYQMMQPEGQNTKRQQDFQVRSFTDNLIIGYPIPEHSDAVSILLLVMDYIGYFQMEMAGEGYFIRGAISIGNLYIDEDIIFGPALMEAYRAEQKLAVYPRVILCDTAMEPFQGDWQWGERRVSGVLKDSDQRVFIDYLKETVMIAYPDAGPFTEFLEKHKEAVSAKLIEFSEQPYIKTKYEWAANYHNGFCNNYPEEFDDSHKISQKLLATPPQPWIPTKARLSAD